MRPDRLIIRTFLLIHLLWQCTSAESAELAADSCDVRPPFPGTQAMQDEAYRDGLTMQGSILLVYDKDTIKDERDPAHLLIHGQIENTNDSMIARRYTETSYKERLAGARNDAYVAYYGVTDRWLRAAFRAHAPGGGSYAVMGSVDPWYETFAAHVGSADAVIVVEYHTIVPRSPNRAQPRDLARLFSKVTYLTPHDIDVLRMSGNKIRVDSIVSISSYEHDGRTFIFSFLLYCFLISHAFFFKLSNSRTIRRSSQ